MLVIFCSLFFYFLLYYTHIIKSPREIFLENKIKFFWKYFHKRANIHALWWTTLRLDLLSRDWAAKILVDVVNQMTNNASIISTSTFESYKSLAKRATLTTIHALTELIWIQINIANATSQKRYSLPLVN